MSDTEAKPAPGWREPSTRESETRPEKKGAAARLQQRVKDRLLRPPFSDDIFISYSRADGPTYAAGIATKLAGQDFACRFDQWETKPGRKIPRELRRALRRSAVFVLVGTPGAAASEHVQDEVVEFKKTGRNIIPIIFDGVRLSDGIYQGGIFTRDEPGRAGAPPAPARMKKARWADDIFGAPFFLENNDALVTGEPSEEILQRIKNNFAFKRKDERLRKGARLLFGLLLFLAAAVAVAAYFAGERGAMAAAATKEAADAAKAAASAGHEAARQQAHASEATLRATLAGARAEEQSAVAEQERTRAETQTRKADAATVRANVQTEIALKAERRAVTATARADQQERRAQSGSARNYYNQAQAESADDPARALVWAQKALETAPPEDDRRGIYKLRALHLAREAPRTAVSTGAEVLDVVYSPAHDKAITITARENRHYRVWNLATGEALPDPMAGCGCEYAAAGPPVFSADGRWAALAYHRLGGPAGQPAPLHLRVWETDTGKMQFDVTEEALKALSAAGARGSALRPLGFSPDGSTVMLGRDDRGARECQNFRTNQHVLMLERASGTYLRSVATCSGGASNAFNPGYPPRLPLSEDPRRNRMLIVTTDDELRVTDASTGKVEMVVRPDKPLQEAGISRDGSRVLAVTGEDAAGLEVRSWEIGGGGLTARVPLGGNHVLDASRDGRRLLVADKQNSKLSMLEVDGGRLTPVVDTQRTGTWFNARLGDDEKHVATELMDESSGDWVIDIWETLSGANVTAPIAINPGEGGSYSINPSAAAVTFLEKGAGLITVQDFSRKGFENLLPFERLPLTPGHMFFRSFLVPDGRSLITLKTDEKVSFSGPSSLQLWDVKTGRPLWPSEKAEGSFHLIEFSPDGDRFIAQALERRERGHLQTVIRMRSKETGEIIPGFRPITGHHEDAAFSRDGKQLVTARDVPGGGPELRRWDATTGAELPHGLSGPLPGNMEVRTLTRHGEFLVLVAPNSATLTDPRDFSVLSLKPGDGRRLNFVFSRNESAALAVAILQQAREVTFAGDRGLSASFGPGFSITLTAAETGATISYREAGLQYLAPYKGIISFQNIRLSPDAKLLVTREPDTGGRGLRVWETKTGQPISGTLLHETTVNEFEFTPDGERLVTVTRDGRVRSWYVGSPGGATPGWMARIGEALTGLRLEGAEVNHIKPGDYVTLRRRHGEAVRKAVEGGDASARFVSGGPPR